MMSYGFGEGYVYPTMIGSGKKYWVNAIVLSSPSIRGVTKSYKDMKRQYWWKGIKRDVGRYISKCAVCQQVKIEHQRPGGLLQSLPIPKWKWDHITMDFVYGFPQTARGQNSVWVIDDKLTKSAHFLGMKTIDITKTLSQLYIREIVRLHGVLLSIV